MQKPRILFISRAYPPIFGGIEKQNYGIAQALSQITETKIIANKKGKIFLPLFLPWITLKSLVLLSSYDTVLLGDGVLSPIGALLKIFYPSKKFFCIIHGLDITFAWKKSLLGKIYKAINIPCHQKMDKLIMVGNETIIQSIKIGIPKEKCIFIPNGVNPTEICEPRSRAELEELLGMNLEGKKVIARVGRYVKHKGTEWFIENVMPKLPEDYIFVAAGSVVADKTAGDENMYPACQKAVRENNLKERVKLLTNLPWNKMKILFNTADLFVSPNIKVEGTMEGFGINAIEAAVCERVVVASRLEGLQDAIIDGQNGFLVAPADIQKFVDKITEMLDNEAFRKEFGEKARQFTIEHYSWEIIAKKYLDEIEKTITPPRLNL